ncbi:proline-rich protein 5-like isoform X2 [Uloborus diversus]|uniref:proline-rich protein 5-like isoform X2 n=1 Tax=Uloborus diversus TaxID=327109 RepID=UPI00240948EB|nr:proline-rich protein 5-like isoform X2 [Uloborus diversus]
MASRLIRSKATVTGLRSVQNLSSLAVPSTLEQVPEDSEIKSKCKIFASDDWKCVDNAVKRIFKDEDLLTFQGEFFKLHQNVENILRSKTGTFLSDCYKEWITKEMIPVIGKLKRLDRSTFLQRLEDVWISFYSKTLPLLEAIFYQVKPKGRLSIRCTTLVAFRDVILLSSDIEAVPAYGADVSPEIRRMILLLQNVNDSYPPSKNKIRMESLAARICSPFMGYMGMYQKGYLVVTSSEPMHAARRRPSAVEVGGPRRISRPFSVQPHQMDTLNELFKTAVRHQDRK